MTQQWATQASPPSPTPPPPLRDHVSLPPICGRTVCLRSSLVRNASGVVGHEFYELYCANECRAIDQVGFGITAFLVARSADEKSATCCQVILYKIGHWLKTFFFDGIGYTFYCQAYTLTRQEYHGILA